MAFEPLMKDRRIAIVKLEAVPGTMETLVDADANLKMRADITMDKTIEEYTSKMASDDHDYDASIMGKRFGKIKLGVDLYRKTSIAAVPVVAKLMNMCGLRSTVHGTTGNSFNSNILEDGTCGTIWIQTPRRGLASAVHTRFKGSMGNLRILVDRVGAPFRAEFDMDAVLDSIVDVSGAGFLDYTSVDNEKAEAVIGSNMTLAGVRQKFDKVAFDLGNKIGMDTDAGDASGAGIAQFHVESREPFIEIDPAAVALADDDFWSQWTNGTALAYLARSANISLSAGVCQIVGVPEGDRAGMFTHNKRLRLLRDPAIGSPFRLLFGAIA